MNMTRDNIPSPTETPNALTPKNRLKRRLIWGTLLTLFLTPFIGLLIYTIIVYPTLPDASSLKDVSYQVPLKIVTSDNKLITEIGTKKRIPLDYTQIPEEMTYAIISAEDGNFFHHGGVDFKGLARAVYELITTGHKKSGGSTITMQVARNFFLSKKKTYTRKLNEIILSYKIEHQITKQQILALYLNKIFLGYRSYGVAAAAQTYYDKSIDNLTLDEYAMIAGLPKAPSAYNPVANPSRAKLRRNYVLGRMFDNHYITKAQMLAAQAVPVHATISRTRIDVEAGYVAEMARQFALDKFGSDALKNGLTIVTTINSHLQTVANHAVRDGLQAYARRHGYRGVIKHLSPTQITDTQWTLKQLNKIRNYGGLKTAVVTQLTDSTADILLSNGSKTQLKLENMTWAAPYIDVNNKGEKPTKVTDVLKIGDVIYVQSLNNEWRLAQDPVAESALISISPKNGKIFALVGGFDYFKSKFNRVMMGKRQVGSNIKPFLYSSALAKGMTAATTINDAPIVFHDAALEDTWRPENYSGRFYGPTRLRSALAHSRNLVSIRLLKKIGIDYAVKYIERFGFSKTQLEADKNLSLALGSVQFTPYAVVRGYATFANTGFLVTPYLIQEVKGFDGKVIYQAQPSTACTEGCDPTNPQNAPRVITADNAYIMTTLMQDVINHGSGRKAKALKRMDIAGKTGTTNEQKDAWFSGFNPDVVTSVWSGFDKPKTLGRREVGGRASLPIWMQYMAEAFKAFQSPNVPFLRPDNLVSVPIDLQTGQAVPADTPKAYFEVFRPQYAPKIPKASTTQMKKLSDELFQ